LTLPAFRPISELVEDRNEHSRIGEIFGAYKIESEIGRGGMGTVYLASRADEAFDKKVALKLIKRGFDTDEIVSRFRHERQILAVLEHPGRHHAASGRRIDRGWLAVHRDGLCRWLTSSRLREQEKALCHGTARDISADLLGYCIRS
jgi:serine/threonine protein kinase